MKSSIRPASHSGSWYDDNPKQLSKELSAYLSESKQYDQYNTLKV